MLYIPQVLINFVPSFVDENVTNFVGLIENIGYGERGPLLLSSEKGVIHRKELWADPMITSFRNYLQEEYDNNVPRIITEFDNICDWYDKKLQDVLQLPTTLNSFNSGTGIFEKVMIIKSGRASDSYAFLKPNVIIALEIIDILMYCGDARVQKLLECGFGYSADAIISEMTLKGVDFSII